MREITNLFHKLFHINTCDKITIFSVLPSRVEINNFSPTKSPAPPPPGLNGGRLCSFRFTTIPIHYKYFYSYNEGIDISRQILITF